MKEDEQLREALLELELLRSRETERLRETTALLSALEALTVSRDVSEGISALLSSARNALNCDHVLILAERDGFLVLEESSSELSQGLEWSAPGLLTRPRRIVDITTIGGLWESPPDALAQMKSLLSVPLADTTQKMVLVAMSHESGQFSSVDADLLNRLTAVASQAILRRSLESRNAFLAAVIDKSPVSVAIADATDAMPLVYVNDAFIGLTGYAREEILGQNCRLLSAEEPDSAVRGAIRETVRDLDAGEFTLCNRKKSGEIFWNELRLFPIDDERGNTTHMVATQTDATQRVQAEIDRDEARRRLESALTATTEGFLILGRGGQVRFANTTFEKFVSPIQLRRGELLPEQVLQLLIGADRTPASEVGNDYFRQPTNREVTTADGRQFLVRARAIPDGGAVVAASDITQIKVNERVLRQRLAAIERSQDGVAIGDRDGRLVDVNPSLLSLWNLTDESEILGRKWTKFYDAASMEIFSANEALFLRTGVWRGEAEISHHGRVHVHDVSLSLVPEVGSVLIVRDITERRRNAEERSELRRRLDRAQMQERLHQVSAGLAHDFNNLLSAILGSASVIEGAESLSQPAQEAVNRIQIAANRAAELTDSFLDLGAREKAPETIELGSVLRNVVDLARGGAPRGVRLSASLQETPLMVEASQTDLLQVVMNLVVNGIDAHEGMPGEVRVSVKRGAPEADNGSFVLNLPKSDQEYCAIVVEDTGKGMSDDVRKNILEPYFTTKGNTGTGLGLSIVGSIINDNEALLELVSEPGRGCKFTVWWPISQKNVPARPQTNSSMGQKANLPILILDDVPEVASAIATYLSGAGYEVAETVSPDVALETIEEDPEAWGCLVTDYDMPGMTGGDLIEQLRSSAPDLPVVVVSALARRLTDKRLGEAIAVLQKPVDKDKLLAVVSAATTANQELGDE